MSQLMESQNSNPEARGRFSARSNIIAVGGGKGGVGKSFVSTGIAFMLAKMGYKTLLIDLDLGSANLHTYLGMQPARKGLNDFLSDPAKSLSDIVQPSPIPHLNFIGGNNDPLDMAELDIALRSRLLSSIFNLQSDYIILDLSAGTNATTLDFFLLARQQVITVTPDPSSVENAYRFMKAAFYRKIKRHERQLGLEKSMHEIMTHTNINGIRTPADLLKKLQAHDQVRGEKLNHIMQTIQPYIVLNQKRTEQEGFLGESISSVYYKYFGFKARYAGAIDFDNAVWQSLRKRKHVLIESPHTPTYAQLLTIAKGLSHSKDRVQEAS